MGKRRSRAADEKAPPEIFVWKTIADPFAGRITLFRVVSGTLKSDSPVLNKTRDTTERFGSLQLLQGKTPAAVPGDQGGRPGRRGQAEGHADQRHAGRQEPTSISRSRSIDFP